MTDLSQTFMSFAFFGDGQKRDCRRRTRLRLFVALIHCRKITINLEEQIIPRRC
jgi:hypothetical protein